MAVEARHINDIPQQIMTNRDLVNSNHGYGYNSQMGSGIPFTSTKAVNFLPLNQSYSVQGKTSLKADSGLTYNLPVNVPRKRSRDSMDIQKNNLQDLSSFFGEDNFSFQIQQHQLEMEHIISQHTKKIRLELEERQKQQASMLVSVIGEGVIRKLQEKDEQIQKMGKLNFALQERVKSLIVENQFLRELAQTNEATAMSLRCNLEQVLAHVSEDRLPIEVAEVEYSCCGSSDPSREDDEEEVVGRQHTVAADGGCESRMCRKCGNRESSVLLLPCRHLCLCTNCGTSLPSICPVCNSNMNATVHVNMS